MVDVFEYKNPVQGVLCSEKIEEYNVLARTLNLKYNCAQGIITGAVGVVSAGLETYEYIKRTPPNIDNLIDLDNINFNTGGDLSGLAECLISNIPFANGVDSVFSSILSSAKTIYTDAINKVMDAVKSIKDRAGSFITLTAEKIKQIINKIESAFFSILDPITNSIFKALDKINDYLNRVNIAQEFQKLQNFTECLSNYCGQSSEMMIDISRVVDGSNTNFPVDRYTGEFKPYKLFNRGSMPTTLADKVGLLNNDYIGFTGQRIAAMDTISAKLTESLF